MLKIAKAQKTQACELSWLMLIDFSAKICNIWNVKMHPVTNFELRSQLGTNLSWAICCGELPLVATREVFTKLFLMRLSISVHICQHLLIYIKYLPTRLQHACLLNFKGFSFRKPTNHLVTVKKSSNAGAFIMCPCYQTWVSPIHPSLRANSHEQAVRPNNTTYIIQLFTAGYTQSQSNIRVYLQVCCCIRHTTVCYCW